MRGVATRGEGRTIKIGRDFVESACGKPVWKIEPSQLNWRDGSWPFTVNFECTMDEAQACVVNTLAKEGKRAGAFQLQRV